MSMIKQLWISIAIVALLAFGGSLVLSTFAARHYLTQQLHLKNIDNASSLALSMSQLPKDPVTVELLLSAQFDAGHYELIRLSDPEGKPLVVREASRQAEDVPAWLMRLIPIDVPAGVAQVQDGWQQFGTLTVKSHNSFAYQSLWQGTERLLLWFLAGGLACGLIGTLLLRRVVGPLDEVVEQARAIGERRFLTVREPATAELRAVVRAMNAMSGRVRSMLEEESARLEELRRAAQNDTLTGLLNREHFLSRLQDALADENAAPGGTLAVLRIADLAGINQRAGREVGDAILKRLGSTLEAIRGEHESRVAGRLSGTDLALLVADDIEPEALAQEIGAAIDLAIGPIAGELERPLPLGLAWYRRSDQITQVLAHADRALERSRQSADGVAIIENVDGRLNPPAKLSHWRSAIEQALAGGRLTLRTFPVLSPAGLEIHREAPVRLRLDDQSEWLTAGEFMPWASRAGMLAQVDGAVLELALEHLRSKPYSLCINLAAESICDPQLVAGLASRLAAAPELAQRLWLDLPEATAFRHAAEFRRACAALKPLGVRIGLEHVGQYVCRIGELHDVGLDYLKIGSAVIRGIDSRPGNQTFLRGLATIAHTMGILVIAEGVTTASEAQHLKSIGFDGLTGPGITGEA